MVWLRAKTPKLTKSIRLTQEEAEELGHFIEETGSVEAAVLKRLTLRGLREERVDQAVLDYLRHRDSSRAAAIAHLPRAQFLDSLAERGVTLLDAPPTLAHELANLAVSLNNARLAQAAEQLAQQRSA
jgi:hypothetical protein